jgi:hypothetical protein
MMVPRSKVHVTGAQSLTVYRLGACRAAEPSNALGELRREWRRHVLSQQNWHGYAISEGAKKRQQGGWPSCRAADRKDGRLTLGRWPQYQSRAQGLDHELAHATARSVGVARLAKPQHCGDRLHAETFVGRPCTHRRWLKDEIGAASRTNHVPIPWLIANKRSVFSTTNSSEFRR